MEGKPMFSSAAPISAPLLTAPIPLPVPRLARFLLLVYGCSGAWPGARHGRISLFPGLLHWRGRGWTRHRFGGCFRLQRSSGWGVTLYSVLPSSYYRTVLYFKNRIVICNDQYLCNSGWEKKPCRRLIFFWIRDDFLRFGLRFSFLLLLLLALLLTWIARFTIWHIAVGGADSPAIRSCQISDQILCICNC